jgi:hypothetical protein
MKNPLIFIFVLNLLFVSAQTVPVANKTVKPKLVKPASVLNDFAVVLHEETMNKVFDAMGEISGTNDYSIMLISGKYHWTVLNPRINLKPDSSDFTCDAKVDVGPFEYKTPVKGRVKIWFDNDKNLINVQITTAIFELYTKILGTKIHIKDIELADYFKDPFQFEGPKSMGTDFEFITPDSVVKKIYVLPSECEMEVQWKQIATRCEVKVADKPFSVPVPVNDKQMEVKANPADGEKKKNEEVKK